MYLWETRKENKGCKINSSWRYSTDLETTEVAYAGTQRRALQNNTCLASQKSNELDSKLKHKKNLLQCISAHLSLLKCLVSFFPG